MSDLPQRLEFAKNLALQAGDIMLKYFQVGMEKESKEDGSPVTIADKAINHMVIEAIAKAYPHDGVLGEEESLVNYTAEYLWVCDPLDGTLPYSFGIPINMFTLALLRDGSPLLSVVYDPYMKRLFQAIQGGGAFCNDKAIQVNQQSDLKKSIVATTGRNTNKAFDAFAFRGKLFYHISRQPQFLSFSYEGAMVALGQFEAAVFPGIPTHDVAPLVTLIREAGGKVTDLAGNDQRYDRPINGAILSNGLVHDDLVQLVKPYLAPVG